MMQRINKDMIKKTLLLLNYMRTSFKNGNVHVINKSSLGKTDLHIFNRIIVSVLK